LVDKETQERESCYNKTMQFQFFSKNGDILPIEQANIPLSNIAYQYGFGVYETLKVRNGVLFFVEQHVERLFTSAKEIGLGHEFTKEEIKDWIEKILGRVFDREAQTESVQHNEEKFSCNLKILLIGGKTKSDAELFILPLAPLFPDRKLYTEGAKTMTVQYERIFPHAKTLNMLPSYVAYTKAKEQGCYDALLTNKHGNILEGTRTNFFTIKDRTIFTPNKDHILEGVTRQTVLFVAKKHGFLIEAWDISEKALHEYDGAFVTSTSSKIVPIKQIDDFVFQEIPEALQELMKLYDRFLEKSRGVFTEQEPTP
jgi:branched-chain amino acid aminotransferase